MADFYVYCFSCPQTKKPFYIGKGRGKRWYWAANQISDEELKDDAIKYVKEQI